MMWKIALPTIILSSQFLHASPVKHRIERPQSHRGRSVTSFLPVTVLPRPAVISESPPVDAASEKFAVRGVNFWYGTKQALFDINLSVPERSVVAFIGPSGCGKST